MDGATFFANLNNEIPKELEEKLIEAVNKYLIDKIPVQHIIGYTYFYGYKMIVNNQVLIPRPETEELVSYVLQAYDEVFVGQKVDVVDIGTGSGAIAIALSKEEPNFSVIATDISKEALKVAELNALENKADVKFLNGDMIEPLLEKKMKFDILVSNPPYIPDNEYVEEIVKNNEPSLALFGGNDGMHFYDVILKNAHKILKDKFIIAFEHSYSKKKEMIELANKYFSNASIEVIKDLNGKDRFTIIIGK